MTTKFEKDIISDINSFRSDPRSVQHQIEVLRKGISRLRPNDPFLGEIDRFVQSIGSIKKMPNLTYNQTLSQACKEEVKKFSRDEGYNKYRTGNQLKGIVSDAFIKENAALIADDGADEAETVVSKLLLNKADKEKKGRKMLTTPEYTQIGIASIEYNDENYIVIIFANNDCPDEGDPELPNGDLSLLKQAFDLYDHDGTQKIRIQEAIDGMQSVKFDQTNPVLYEIIEEMNENEWVSWPKFASHVWGRVTDRNTDEGLRTLFDLFIDNPKQDTITFETFKRICNEVGENMSDEEMRNILEVTTNSGKDISFEDFCQYMRLIP